MLGCRYCGAAVNGYNGAMANSVCLLEKKFGVKQRYYQDHWPTMAFRPAIEELESMFTDEWLRTAMCGPLDCSTDLFWGSITQMYMVDSGRGAYSGTSPSSAAKFYQIHTNAGGECSRVQPRDGQARLPACSLAYLPRSHVRMHVHHDDTRRLTLLLTAYDSFRA